MAATSILSPRVAARLADTGFFKPSRFLCRQRTGVVRSTSSASSSNAADAYSNSGVNVNRNLTTHTNPSNIKNNTSSGNNVHHVIAEPDLAQARLAADRNMQRRSTDLLAALLEANDPVGVARQQVDGLSEEFFMTASTYLTLARSEGNADVASRIERAVGAAWEVKQSTLRPELQLLNSLVRAESDAARREIYTSGGPDLVATLSLNNRWFAATLARMTSDVERQPPNPGKGPLLMRLRAVAKETEALARQAALKEAAARGQRKQERGGQKG